jgi:hypothetical protein
MKRSSRGTHLGHRGACEGGGFGWWQCLLFSTWWLMVRAAYDGSLTVLRVKMGSRHPGEASCAGSQAWEGMVLRDGGEGGS